MNCLNIEEMIQDYLDGLLSDEQKAEVDAHVETCEACQEYFHMMQMMMNSLQGMEEVEVPEGLHEDIMATVIAHQETQKKDKFFVRFNGLMKPAITVVAAAFLLFVVFAVIQPQQLLDMTTNDTVVENSSGSTKTFDTTATRMDDGDRSGSSNTDSAMPEEEMTEMTSAADEAFEVESSDDDGAMTTDDSASADAEMAGAEQGTALMTINPDQEETETVESFGSEEVTSDVLNEDVEVARDNEVLDDGAYDITENKVTEGSEDRVEETHKDTPVSVEMGEESSQTEAFTVETAESVQKGMSRILVILGVVLMIPLIVVILYILLRRKIK